MNAFFFWIFSAGMLLFGLAVILNRNPVASALCFAFTIVFMSALFVMLNAFFLAAVQILVTAGAVMVLFLFIIMLLDITAAEHRPRQKVWMGFALLLALGFLYVFARTLQATPGGERTTASLPPVPEQVVVEHYRSHGNEEPGGPMLKGTVYNYDDTHQIGRLLFTKYVAAFEVTSLLILVATIGVIVICKQDDKRPAPGEEIASEAPPLAKSEPAPTR